MRTFRVALGAGTLVACAVNSSAAAPALSATDLTMAPGSVAVLVVDGQIDGESTFGVSLLLELVPRPGSQGTLSFTTSPPIDVTQLGDPWPGAGSFTPYDTDSTGSLSRNGAVDDNGSFIPASTTFSGSLASFPVVAGPTAVGVWDVALTTPLGDSGWEGVATTLVPAAITVGSPVAVPALGTWGLITSALATAAGGTVVIRARRFRSPVGLRP